MLVIIGKEIPFGSFVPTMKISINSDSARKKPHWIDFDAGSVLETGDVNSLAEFFRN